MDDFKEGEVEDLATLARLDEKVLLNELKVRYNKNRIYVSNISKHQNVLDYAFPLTLSLLHLRTPIYSKFCCYVTGFRFSTKIKCKERLVAHRVTLVVALAFLRQNFGKVAGT